MSTQKTAIQLLAQELQEMREKHGKTVEYDVKNNGQGQLLQAAKGLLLGLGYKCPKNMNAKVWDNMFNKSQKERLIYVAAFMIAEVERQDSVEAEAAAAK